MTNHELLNMCTPREPNIMSVLQEINKNLEKLLAQFVDKNKPTNPYDMSEVKKKWDAEKQQSIDCVKCGMCNGSGKLHNHSLSAPFRCPDCQGMGFIKVTV